MRASKTDLVQYSLRLLVLLGCKLKSTDLQHHVFQLVFCGQLQHAPIFKPKMVLDLGTGTGLWATQYGQNVPFSWRKILILESDAKQVCPMNRHICLQTQQWNRKVVEGARLLGGKDWWCAIKYPTWFEKAGFEDVVLKKFLVPINSWPRDKRQKEIGRVSLENTLNGLEGMSLAVYVRAYGMSAEEVQAELADVRKEFQSCKCFRFRQEVIRLCTNQ